MAMKRNGKSHVSSVNSHPSNGQSQLTSANPRPFMLFRDVSLGPHEAELRFRLIHFWEARNPLNKLLIGLEMLLIDEEGAVIQGFIPSGRVDKYMPRMKPGAVYRLINFYGSKGKTVFRVADYSVTVSFSWNSDMSPLDNSPLPFGEDRFRFHSSAEFDSNCDGKGDLYDVVGHMKVVNGQTLTDRPTLDVVDIETTRRVLLHVQSYDGRLIKLYLWDQAAAEFCKKFNSSENTPTVILVTTVYPKCFGGALSLTYMASSRVFLDYDAQPTRDYLSWLGGNPEVANRVNAEVVTKTETLTLGEIYSYIKKKDVKCTATIDDVVHGSSMYYISCGGCHTKATKGSTSLMCSKCEKDNITGVARYLAKISVYGNSEQGVFVLLGDAGYQLIGKHASELVANYYEANDEKGVDKVVPVPQELINTIGQTHRFIVKVSERNFTGSTRSITVTKVLPKEASPAPTASDENSIAPSSAVDVSGSSKISGDTGDDGAKRASNSVEPEEAKRPKTGN